MQMENSFVKETSKLDCTRTTVVKGNMQEDKAKKSIDIRQWKQHFKLKSWESE